MKEIDLIGQTQSLTAGGHSRLKTNIGGFATLFLLFSTMGAFVAFGLDLFKKENPTVVFNKQQNDLEGNTFTHENFALLLFDQDSSREIPEFNRKFVTYANYYITDGKGNWKAEKYYFEECTDEIKEKWKVDAISKAPIMCFPKDKKISLNGTFGEGAYSTVRIQTVYCKNNTDPARGPVVNNCYDRSFIEKNITARIQMQLIFSSSQVNTYNYTNPGYGLTVNKLSNSNTNTWTRLMIRFKKIDIETNQGFLFEDIHHDVYNAIESFVAESIYTPGTEVIFSHMMGNAKYKDVYKRDYIMIQNVFALMGGFVNGARLILMALVQYATTPDIVNIFNSIYKYNPVKITGNNQLNKNNKSAKVNESPKQNPNQSGQPLTNKNPISENKFIRNDPVINNFTDAKINDIRNKYEKMKNFNYDYSMGMIKRVFRVCTTSKMSSQKMAYDKTKSKMDSVLSIENVIKMTRDQNVMKLLFLEEYQEEILSVSPIPFRGYEKNKRAMDIKDMPDFLQHINLETNQRICKLLLEVK